MFMLDTFQRHFDKILNIYDKAVGNILEFDIMYADDLVVIVLVVLISSICSANAVENNITCNPRKWPVMICRTEEDKDFQSWNLITILLSVVRSNILLILLQIKWQVMIISVGNVDWCIHKLISSYANVCTKERKVSSRKPNVALKRCYDVIIEETDNSSKVFIITRFSRLKALLKILWINLSAGSMLLRMWA